MIFDFLLNNFAKMLFVRESHPNQIVIVQTNNFGTAAADTTCDCETGERARGEKAYTDESGRKS